MVVSTPAHAQYADVLIVACVIAGQSAMKASHVLTLLLAHMSSQAGISMYKWLQETVLVVHRQEVGH